MYPRSRSLRDRLLVVLLSRLSFGYDRCGLILAATRRTSSSHRQRPRRASHAMLTRLALRFGPSGTGANAMQYRAQKEAPRR